MKLPLDEWRWSCGVHVDTVFKGGIPLRKRTHRRDSIWWCQIEGPNSTNIKRENISFEQLEHGDIIEIGDEYTSARGIRRANREYYVVAFATEEGANREVYCESFDTLAAAIAGRNSRTSVGWYHRDDLRARGWSIGMIKLGLPQPDARVFWRKDVVHAAEEIAPVLDVIMLSRLADNNGTALKDAQRHAISAMKRATAR